MKRSFTLIEVIISVILLALVGVALLKNSMMSIDFFDRIIQKSGFVDKINIVANHAMSDYNHLQKRLEDFLQDRYVIDDKELLKIAQEKKFLYQEARVKIASPMLEDFNRSDEEEESNDTLNIYFLKISISSKDGGDYIYKLVLDE